MLIERTKTPHNQDNTKQSNQRLCNSVEFISRTTPQREGEEGNLFFYKEKQNTEWQQGLMQPQSKQRNSATARPRL